MTRDFKHFRITPHFTNDSTNKIIFLVFERGAIVLDVQYNNGGWLLYIGNIEDRVDNTNDRTDLVKFTGEWVKEFN